MQVVLGWVPQKRPLNKDVYASDSLGKSSREKPERQGEAGQHDEEGAK